MSNFWLFNFVQVISTWGVQNKIDFISLSYTRHAEDVREVCTFITSRFLFLDSFTGIDNLHLSRVLDCYNVKLTSFLLLKFRPVSSYLSWVI